MDTQNEARERVLQNIIERELAMFLAAPNEGGPAACQQRPETFRLMRWMAHAVHDNATLLSYLRDLEEAESNGRNFMIEKYARMDDRIPPLSANPRITAIADAEALWLEEAARRYPLSLSGATAATCFIAIFPVNWKRCPTRRWICTSGKYRTRAKKIEIWWKSAIICSVGVWGMLPLPRAKPHCGNRRTNNGTETPKIQRWPGLPSRPPGNMLSRPRYSKRLPDSMHSSCGGGPVSPPALFTLPAAHATA